MSKAPPRSNMINMFVEPSQKYQNNSHNNKLKEKIIKAIKPYHSISPKNTLDLHTTFKPISSFQIYKKNQKKKLQIFQQQKKNMLKVSNKISGFVPLENHHISIDFCQSNNNYRQKPRKMVEKRELVTGNSSFRSRKEKLKDIIKKCEQQTFNFGTIGIRTMVTNPQEHMNQNITQEVFTVRALKRSLKNKYQIEVLQSEKKPKSSARNRYSSKYVARSQTKKTNQTILPQKKIRPWSTSKNPQEETDVLQNQPQK